MNEQHVTQCCFKHAERKEGIAMIKRLQEMKLQRKVEKKKKNEVRLFLSNFVETNSGSGYEMLFFVY